MLHVAASVCCKLLSQQHQWYHCFVLCITKKALSRNSHCHPGAEISEVLNKTATRSEIPKRISSPCSHTSLKLLRGSDRAKASVGLPRKKELEALFKAYMWKSRYKPHQILCSNRSVVQKKSENCMPSQG